MEKGLNNIIRQLQHDWNNQKVSKQTVLYTLKSFKRFDCQGLSGLMGCLDLWIAVIKHRWVLIYFRLVNKSHLFV